MYRLHHARCSWTSLASCRQQELTERGQTLVEWCTDAQHISIADNAHVTSMHCAGTLLEVMTRVAVTPAAKLPHEQTLCRRLTAAMRSHVMTKHRRWTYRREIGACHAPRLIAVCWELTDLSDRDWRNVATGLPYLQFANTSITNQAMKSRQ